MGFKQYKKRDNTKWYKMELYILGHEELTLRDKIILITLASWRGSGVICPKIKQISERLNYSSTSDISKSLQKSKTLGIINWNKHANKSNEYYFCYDLLAEGTEKRKEKPIKEEVEGIRGSWIDENGKIQKRLKVV